MKAAASEVADSAAVGLAPVEAGISYYHHAGDELRLYGTRTWGDLFAAKPIARADRFGAPGFFETVRVNGGGSPLVIWDGVPLIRGAGGLHGTGSFPAAAVDRISLGTPRVLTGHALSAPDGVIVLDPARWEGGVPRSIVGADQKSGAYQSYRFGFERDIPSLFWLQTYFGTRQVSEFVEESFDGMETNIRVGREVGSVEVTFGHWRNKDERYVLDNDVFIAGGFSHTAGDEHRVNHLTAEHPSLGKLQWYYTSLQSHARPLVAEESADFAREVRSGALMEWAAVARGVSVQCAIRHESREALADGNLGQARRTNLAGYLSVPVHPALENRISVNQEIVEDGDAVTGAEFYAGWKSGFPVYLRLLRAPREASLRNWSRGLKIDGVIHYGEVGVAAPRWPGTPSVRYFRRHIDGATHLWSTSTLFEDGERFDERTGGVECAATGEWGGFETETSWLWAKIRDDGSAVAPPYHSDHTIRGRLSYRREVPFIEAPGRIDLIGEWKSDRLAPGRESPMDRWAVIRGRFTINVNGVDLYGQLEQIGGHQLEYLDGPAPTGTGGVYSGSLDLYLGLVWPLED